MFDKLYLILFTISIKPFQPLSIFPKTFSKITFYWYMFTIPMLLSVFPFAFEIIIGYSISVRALDEDCVSVESSAFPFTFVDVVAGICYFSMAVRKVVLPIPLISCSVYCPDLHAKSIFLSVLPFTSISISSIRTNPFFSYRMMTLRSDTMRFRPLFLTCFLW